LNSLIDKEFIFIAFPLKIENGDGSPVRAVALID
jgi:kynurenine formamidase